MSPKFKVIIHCIFLKPQLNHHAQKHIRWQTTVSTIKQPMYFSILSLKCSEVNSNVLYKNYVLITISWKSINLLSGTYIYDPSSKQVGITINV